MRLIKPPRLRKGDTIAAVSPCNGWAGDPGPDRLYRLGKRRLEGLGLTVVPAPNALRGSDYLSKNPQARAEDIQWAFENTAVRGIIANMGGNDSHRVVPYIPKAAIKDNPKIFIGYSDVMTLHILCYRCGLASFYGDNLLSPVGEAGGWHPYSRRWFKKALMDGAAPGSIEPAAEWSCDPVEYFDPDCPRRYVPNEGYVLLQGKGKVQGRLMGGHTGLMDLQDTPLELTGSDFHDRILFLEDIPSFYTPQRLTAFFSWLRAIDALSGLRGILLGRAAENTEFSKQAAVILRCLRDQGLSDLPVLYGLNFGHSSPMCVLPYGVLAEIQCESRTVAILESGVT